MSSSCDPFQENVAINQFNNYFYEQKTYHKFFEKGQLNLDITFGKDSPMNQNNEFMDIQNENFREENSQHLPLINSKLKGIRKAYSLDERQVFQGYISGKQIQDSQSQRRKQDSQRKKSQITSLTNLIENTRRLLGQCLQALKIITPRVTSAQDNFLKAVQLNMSQSRIAQFEKDYQQNRTAANQLNAKVLRFTQLIQHYENKREKLYQSTDNQMVQVKTTKSK